MSTELLKTVLARRAMQKDAALVAKYPDVTWKHMQTPATPAVDKKAGIGEIMRSAVGNASGMMQASPGKASGGGQGLGSWLQRAPLRAAAVGALAKAAPSTAPGSGAAAFGGMANQRTGMTQSIAAPFVKQNSAASAEQKRAVVLDLLQKNAGILGGAKAVIGAGLNYAGRGASAAGRGIAAGGRAAADFVMQHPVATAGTAAAAAGTAGGYFGGKTVGYVQGRRAQGANDADQIARYGVTAGGAALGGLGGNLLAGAFGGGRVARTLGMLLGGAAGGAAGYYAMDPVVQAKVKALFS